MKQQNNMKEFKGTKGKWVLWNDGYAFDVVKESDAIMTIACVYDGKEAENDIDVVVAKANAQLIAAAPELLKALQESNELIEWLFDNGGYTGMETAYNRTINQMNDNQEAINKALGL